MLNSHLNQALQKLPHEFFLSRFWKTLAVLWLPLFGSFPLAAQEKLEPFQVGEKVEVFFLNEWRAGIVRATDKQQNARVEFEFAKEKQVEDFLRAAVRRPYEAGTLVPTRTYADSTGKYQIVAAIVAVSVDEVRFRRSDSTERDVPRTKLSDSDQRFIQRLIKQGLPELATLPPMQSPDARQWNLRNGTTISGQLMGVRDNRITIELVDGSQQEIALNDLTPGDMRFALETQQKKMEDAVEAELAQNSPGDIEQSMKGETPKGDIELSAEPRGASSNSPRPDAAKRAQLLAEDRWELNPDLPSRTNLQRKVNMQEPTLQASLLTSRDGSHLLFLGSSGNTQLTNLQTGESRKVAADLRQINVAALSPDGRYFAYNESRFEPSEWFIYDTENSRPVWSNWKPYGEGKEVYHVEFIDDTHILTLSPRGDLGVWNLETRDLVWWTISRPLSVPAVSPGGKLLFVHTNTHLLAMEGTTGKVLSQVPSNPVGVRVLAVDQSCQKLIGLGHGLARCWDLSSGKATREFAVASAIMDPKFAVWISPDQVAVGGLQSARNMILDIIDVNAEGSVYCLYSHTGSIVASPSQQLWFNIFQGNASILAQPEIPSPEMQELIRAFAAKPLFELPAGSRIEIELTTPSTVNRAEELKRLSELFTAAGYEVVTSDGVATFEVNIREGKNYKDIDLDKLPDDAFRPTKDLMLRVGGEIIWRATRDIYGLDKENVWGGYVIPSSFKLSQPSAPCFGLDESANWKPAKLMRQYRTVIEQKSSFR